MIRNEDAWPPGEGPEAGGDPRTVAEVAQSLGRSTHTRVTWREGSKGRQSSRQGRRARRRDFPEKQEIALEQIDDAIAWGVRKHLVLADSGYGDVGEFQHHGALHTDHVLEPALGESGFAAMHVRVATGRRQGQPAGELQWLLCAWPKAEGESAKFWFSTLPIGTLLKELARCAKLRWRVERDYQEMKQELGLDHFDGRTWRGFRHHASLCAMAHGFLALRRALSPQSRVRWMLPMVRRALQQVLLRRVGVCPLCRRPVDECSLPQGPSRM